MALEIFHEGDLQSGIALAMQQAKIVLCFVKGELSGWRDTSFSKLTD
jgi:hypothetical protein